MFLSLKNNLGEKYSLMYFLGGVGMGGAAVAFYMYLHFTIKRDQILYPIASADQIFPLIKVGDMLAVFLLLDLIAIAYFAYLNFRFLIWNLIEFYKFTKTAAYERFRNSNAEMQLVIIPLSFAMSINVCFIGGAVFIPGLMKYTRYLFPPAIVGFVLCGLFAGHYYLRFAARIMTTPSSFDMKKNNNFQQLLAPATFSMVAVGLGAPAAMSTNKVEVGIAAILCIFFSIVAVLLTVLIPIFSFKSVLENGMNPESGVSLWVMLPIGTLLGVAWFRLAHGVYYHFANHANPAVFMLILTSGVTGFHIIFFFLGLYIMIKQDYFHHFIFGEEKALSGFVLACPFLSIIVFGIFFIHGGLVKNQILEQYSVAYYIITACYAISHLCAVFFGLYVNVNLYYPEEPKEA